MTVTIYHNPRCSKSRATLAILESEGVPLKVIEYLKSPLSKSDIIFVLDALDMAPRDLMRKKETEYEELNLSDPSLGRDALIEAMVANPILIERPIVINGVRCVIGRPPENVLKIM